MAPEQVVSRFARLVGTVSRVERNDAGHLARVTVLTSVGRKAPSRTVADVEKQSDPPAPLAKASFTERMAHRPKTTLGQLLDKLVFDSRTRRHLALITAIKH
jgi:hypothetical protein